MSQLQTAVSAVTAFNIDPAHSNAHFRVRHMMISWVRGEFAKVSGTVCFDPQNPSATEVTAEIDVNSINTREPQRDGHLKSPDFLDAEKFPTIKFQSTTFDAGKGKLTGNLTIRGVTREVVLDIDGPTPETKDPWGNIRTGVEAKTKINRKDFGLAWNQVLEAGGLLVGDDIEITIDVELLKA